jgi:hypothetical protein
VIQGYIYFVWMSLHSTVSLQHRYPYLYSIYLHVDTIIVLVLRGVGIPLESTNLRYPSFTNNNTSRFPPFTSRMIFIVKAQRSAANAKVQICNVHTDHVPVNPCGVPLHTVRLLIPILRCGRHLKDVSGAAAEVSPTSGL